MLPFIGRTQDIGTYFLLSGSGHASSRATLSFAGFSGLTLFSDNVRALEGDISLSNEF